MNRKSIAAALTTAALAVGLTACGSDDEPTTALIPETTSAPTATVSPFGTDSVSELGVKLERDNATTIVETVEQRGGTPQQARAALLATAAETSWRSGLRMSPPSTDIRDIFGWRLSYNLSADSAEVVRAATNTFMDNTATVTVSSDDPVSYALAVQHADPRGYNEKEHFFKKGETAATEYPAALPKSLAAYTELRGSQ
ncbi:hypothetical protein GS979_06455 [Rhodococcus hoagii]|nr:hypothetical protein [Prescottella equi]NKW46056.1 hypothetical protein [Prescottella equi]